MNIIYIKIFFYINKFKNQVEGGGASEEDTGVSGDERWEADQLHVHISEHSSVHRAGQEPADSLHFIELLAGKNLKFDKILK